MDLKQMVAGELQTARQRSLALLDPLPDADLLAQHSPLMSPLVWDLAHVGHYEELWLVRTITGAAPTCEQYDDIYDAFRHPRRERPSLPILGPREARAFVGDVRSRALDVLDRVELDTDLLHDAFVYGMVVQHEHQHDETMLATLQLRDKPYPFVEHAPPGGDTRVVGEVLVDAGPFAMGTDLEPWAYDNERPAHVVDVDAFWIDTVPVTNAAYAAFVDDGGYARPQWWTGEGWTWRNEAGLEHPEFWARVGARGWMRTRFGTLEALPPDEPVQHVCWYEADAYARWAGKRLPTEAEW
ncbi:MAG: SUMF1/EgtB/PvdO family nonheme iron enzyme, partial [Actinobacteria bacterium]|nr:SUMF1/EgtB/PvdO family nonheme iron enzyme [Actinomycetota bacterium]